MAARVHPAADLEAAHGDQKGLKATSSIVTFFLFALFPFAWLLALTLIDRLTSDSYLRDPAISAPTVFIAFLICESRQFAERLVQRFFSRPSADEEEVPEHLVQHAGRSTARRGCCAALIASLRRACGLGDLDDDDLEMAGGVTPRFDAAPSSLPPMISPWTDAFVSAVVPQLIGVWYAAWRLTTYAPPSRLGLEIAHCVLLYVALLLVVGMRRGALSGLPERVRELEVEVSEAKVQYEAVCALLQRRDADDDDDWSEDEGDDREHLIVPPTAVAVPDDVRGDPLRVLPLALNGLKFDQAVALKICKRIRKPNYNLAMFYDDVRTAFPELSLYLAMRQPEHTLESIEEGGAAAGKPAVTSGLSSDDEYRRTIGALFAVYWLMRIGIDGERGFSFGVDDQWRPHERPVLEDGKSAIAPPSEKSAPRKSAAATAATPGEVVSMQPPPVLKDAAKRVAFHDTQDWGRLQQLLIDSGMLEREPGVPGAGGVPGARAAEGAGGVRVNVERTMAMLALTAFHDVMKVEALLPAVKPEHAPYLGFKEGDVINDHDIALGYVLDFHSHLLPSFVAMREHDQKTIRFTQSKMSFNHGWLVQGEAPPAPLFAKFKEVMLSEGVNPSDVAFYFVHWLTDLAGAEPSPLGGAEKFVLKFPHAVLDSFIRSFSVLNDLAVATETEVMERYLVRTWGEAPGRGAPPDSEDGVALMRLVLQAQTPDKQQAVVQAFKALPREDATVLREEMARTGIANQMFKAAPSFKHAACPAFLVYYSPAFIRTLAPANAFEALRILAEVYRRARGLWPLGKTSGNAHHVTVRIDQIKELKVAEIQSAFSQGESWLLCRKNDNEAVVERHTLEGIQEQTAKGIPNSVLKFWRLEKDSGSRQSQVSRGTKSSRKSKESGSFAGSKGVAFSEPSGSGGVTPAASSDAGDGPGAVQAEELQRKLSAMAPPGP